MSPLDNLKEQIARLKAQGCNTSVLEKLLANHQTQSLQAQIELLQKQTNDRRLRQ